MTENNNENPNSENGTSDAPEESFESLKEKLEKSERSNKQLYTRAKKAEGFELKDGEWVKKEEPSKEEEKKEKTSKKGLDYGQKAYLRSEGIKRGAEQELVEEFMENSGKSLEDILDSRVFQAELKSLREDITTKEATPSNSKRSTSTSKDKVDYWIKKGELPPIDQPELRQQVVNAKIKKEKATSNFTSNPVGNVTVK